MLDGLTRRYVVRLPMGYTRERAWPLVLALHGNGGSVTEWDVTTGIKNIRGALADKAVLIIAEAIDGQWRDYAADPSTWPARIDSELRYFDEILTRARTALCLKERSIFAMGFSGGGSFSGVLACRRTDIRAIAVGGAVIYFDPAQCEGTPAAWITIGTQELAAEREMYRDFFRDHAGCSATSMPTTPSPCVAYDGCASATPVHYCQHPDGHVWPDFGTAAMAAFFDHFVED
jgi:poly(3-hydroxybutyrate) depolymerase